MNINDIIFINIAWMNKYQSSHGDMPSGGFRYLKENPNKTVHESWNFKPNEDHCYGYVPRSAQINISNLGAKKDDEFVSGILVVWIARNPRIKETQIVGWYKDAIIHKHAEHVVIEREADYNVGYQIETLCQNVVLIPTDARSFPIPTGKGGLGQSPIWYGGEKKSFKRDVLSYIGKGGSRAKSKGSPRQNDPDKRRKVEQAAIKHATEYFRSPEGGRRQVTSVEKDNVGWDLEAVGDDGEILKIEVKGLSGKDFIVELTPNEYAMMISKDHRQSYMVYIVADALSRIPNAKIFRYNAELSKGNKSIWQSEDDEELQLEERTGARVSIRAT